MLGLSRPRQHSTSTLARPPWPANGRPRLDFRGSQGQKLPVYDYALRVGLSARRPVGLSTACRSLSVCTEVEYGGLLPPGAPNPSFWQHGNGERVVGLQQQPQPQPALYEHHAGALGKPWQNYCHEGIIRQRCLSRVDPACLLPPPPPPGPLLAALMALASAVWLGLTRLARQSRNGCLYPSWPG